MEIKAYTVTKEIFEEDCRILATRINEAPIPKNFNPTHLIALNSDGVKTAIELRKNLSKKNLLIEKIKLNPQTYVIEKMLENKKITNAFLITTIQNTGKLLTKALEYLNAIFENSEEDLELMIIVLYDRLNVSSETYQTPTFFGMGFINHNRIEMEI